MTDLTGKAGLVTGAGSGIGRATALRLARAGASVVVSDIDESTAAGTVEDIRDTGGEAVAVRCDVTDDAEVAALVDGTVAHYGHLDFAHNNAGVVGLQVPLADYTDAGWDRILAVNLTSVYRCMRHELRHMLEQRAGTIVNTASEAALKGGAADAPYTASKHGVAGLTKAVALEVARKGIRVNAVCPGVIETGITRQVAAEDPEMYERVRRLMPVNRYGTPEEVADAVAWLCSDESSLVTGHLLAVDGGWAVS